MSPRRYVHTPTQDADVNTHQQRHLLLTRFGLSKFSGFQVSKTSVNKRFFTIHNESFMSAMSIKYDWDISPPIVPAKTLRVQNY